MVELWQVTALAECVAAVSYGYLAVLIGRNLARGGQWRHNLLGIATFSLFVAGAASRLVFAMHVLPLPSESPAVVQAAHIRMSDPLHVAASVVAAIVAAWFFGQRRALRPLHSMWVWDDLRQRTSDAATLQRDVLARLEEARAHLAAEDQEQARDQVAQALGSAREIISNTLQHRRRHRPGDLRIAGRGP